VVVGVCRWIKQIIKGSKKANQDWLFVRWLAYLLRLIPLWMADSRLFTVLFYLKKSNNSKQKRDVPAVCV